MGVEKSLDYHRLRGRSIVGGGGGRGDQQPEQEPELDPEFSYLGRSLSRSRSGKFFKKPDQEPESELCYGSFSFKLSFAYVRKIEQNSI